MDLFVCGNGFDIKHNIESEYSNFRKWLIREYSLNEDNDECDFSGYSTNYRHLESYDEAQFAQSFLTLIDNAEYTKYHYNTSPILAWNNFEDLIGELDWTKVIEDTEDVYDRDGTINPFKTSENYANSASIALESCHILKSLFRDWIMQIDLDSKKSLKEIEDFFMKKELLYLCFNYTNTLEKLYNINNVLHIHGDISKHNELIFGHNLDDNNYLNEDKAGFYDVEAYNILKGCHNIYKKNSLDIIKEYSDFFNSLSNVNNIYFYGFGFGNSDMNYLKEILHKCKKDVNIFICKFQFKNSKKEIQEALKKCGYNKNVLSMDI